MPIDQLVYYLGDVVKVYSYTNFDWTSATAKQLTVRKPSGLTSVYTGDDVHVESAAKGIVYAHHTMDEIGQHFVQAYRTTASDTDYGLVSDFCVHDAEIVDANGYGIGNVLSTFYPSNPYSSLSSINAITGASHTAIESTSGTPDGGGGGGGFAYVIGLQAKGLVAETGNLALYDWDPLTTSPTQRYKFASDGSNDGGIVCPLQIVDNAGSNLLQSFQPNAAASELDVFIPSSASTLFSDASTTSIGAPNCIINSAGEGVAICSDNDEGLMLSHTSDYGATWSAPYEVDAILADVGAAEYVWTFQYSTGMVLALDKTTDNIYLYTAYTYDSVNWYYRFAVLKSTDGGETWTIVGSWDDEAGTWGFNYMSLEVSNGYIYTATWDPSLEQCKFWFSVDDGANWTNPAVPEVVDGYGWFAQFAASEDTVVWMAPILDSGTNNYPTAKLYRSTNAGTSWSTAITFTANTTPPVTEGYLKFCSASAHDEFMCVTYCDAQYPAHNSTWNDGSAHDTDVAGDHHLCVWVSYDTGANWAQLVSDLPVETWWQQYVSVLKRSL